MKFSPQFYYLVVGILNIIVSIFLVISLISEGFFVGILGIGYIFVACNLMLENRLLNFSLYASLSALGFGCLTVLAGLSGVFTFFYVFILSYVIALILFMAAFFINVKTSKQQAFNGLIFTLFIVELAILFYHFYSQDGMYEIDFKISKFLQNLLIYNQ